MDAYQILVIILSVTLTVFLIVAIVAGILVIQLLKKAKQASETAVEAAHNIQQLAGSVTKLTSGPMLMALLKRAVFKSKNKVK